MKAFLYDADGSDGEVELTPEAIDGLGDHHLLWIDLDVGDGGKVDEVARLLGLDDRSVQRLKRERVQPRLDNFGAYYQFTILAEPLRRSASDDTQRSRHRGRAPVGGHKVDILVGDRWIVTAHRDEVAFLKSYRAQDKAETMLGAMSPQALAASLLDWHLECYFDAVAHFEEAIDEIEERVLRKPRGEPTLSRMTNLKRQVSRLRMLLTAQRSVFYGLARPDFLLVAESPAAPHYATLVSRFERAIDEVEHLHDLVVGSFELFTSRTAEATNDLVKALTFLTLIIGLCAAIAGIFGMNFKVPLMETGSEGFYVIVALQAAALLIGALFVWRKRWL